MTPEIRVRLNVLHEGQPKMAGRMFSHGGSLYVFHESRQGSQYHAKENCSAPVDRLVVLEMLALQDRHGFMEAWFIHRANGADRVQMARASDLIFAPRHSYGGRDRHYLDDNAWRWVPYNKAHNPGHIPTERTLTIVPDWDPVADPNAAAVADPETSPSPQGSLL